MIVNWYIEIMEGGVDTKQMMKYYYSSKERIDNLAQVHSLELAEREKENDRLRDKLRTTRT